MPADSFASLACVPSDAALMLTLQPMLQLCCCWMPAYMQLIGDEHVPMPVLDNQALCLVCHGLALSGSLVHKI